MMKTSDTTPFQQHRSKAGAIFGPLQGPFKALEEAMESSYQSFIKALCSRTPTDVGLGQCDVQHPRNSGTDPGDEWLEDTELIKYDHKATFI